MQFLNDKSIVIICLCAGGISLLASYYSSNNILLIISSILFFLSILIHKFGYMFAPLISKSLSLSIKDADYELVPAQDVLLKKSPDGFHATSFISIPLRDSTEFKSESQKSAYMEMFERSLTSIRFTLKISLIVCNLDLSNYIQKIEERRSLAEHRKSQSKNSAQTSQLEREINHFSSQLERLTSGEKPMQILAYAQTSTLASTKEEAISRIRSQAKEAAAILSGSLGANAQILSGEDLLNCMRWEGFPPHDKSSIENSLF